MLEQQDREAQAKERAERQRAEQTSDDIEEEEVQKVGCFPLPTSLEAGDQREAAYHRAVRWLGCAGMCMPR